MPTSNFVTLLGISTDTKLSQPTKAPPPIYKTLLGMVTDDKPLQYAKAPELIPIVPSFIVILVFSGIVPLYL